MNLYREWPILQVNESWYELCGATSIVKKYREKINIGRNCWLRKVNTIDTIYWEKLIVTDPLTKNKAIHHDSLPFRNSYCIHIHTFANVYFFDKAALNSKTKSFTSYFSLHCNEIMSFAWIRPCIVRIVKDRSNPKLTKMNSSQLYLVSVIIETWY